MADKIDFFDDSRVGAEARRLAHCFNLSARMVRPGGNPLAYVAELFRESTGLDTVPSFNDAEVAFLRLTLAETAAMRAPAGSMTLQEIEEEGELLFKLAEGMQLVRKTGEPSQKPIPIDPDERHHSFPGA